MDKHPEYHRLYAIILRLAANPVRFKGVLYRACTPEYANARDLLTGEGARTTGGRWNPPGSFPMVYLAVSLEGAIAESLGMAKHYGFDPATRLPLTLVAVDAVLDRVLDLTGGAARRTVGLTLSQMSKCPWRSENALGREAITQALGRAMNEAGLQGLLVPSKLKRTYLNLNAFPLNLGRMVDLKIRGADKLPPPGLGTISTTS